MSFGARVLKRVPQAVETDVEGTRNEVKPTTSQRLALGELLELLVRLTGQTQAALVAVGRVRPSEVSKLKRTDDGAGIGPAKWRELVDHLAVLANEASMVAHDRNRLEQLVADLRGSETEPYPAAQVSKYPELQSAYKAVRFSRQGPFGQETPSRWRLVEAQDLYLVVSSYLDEVGQNLGKTLLDTINELGITDPLEGSGALQRRRIRIVEDRPTGAAEDYASMLRLSRIITAPVLCTFPYFLTSSRRTLWGVIPYAKHERLGLLTEKRLLASTFGKTAPSELGPEDFGQLVERGDVRLHTLAGHATEEILSDMAIGLAAARSETAGLLRAFNESVETSQEPLATIVAKFFDPKHVNGRTAEESLRRNESHLIVFDLAYSAKVLSEVTSFGNRDAAVIALRHQVEVPVGIGFSLPAFRWVSAGQRYARLRAAAINSLRPFRSRLRQAGIELDDQQDTPETVDVHTERRVGRRRRREVKSGTRRTAGTRSRQG